VTDNGHHVIPYVNSVDITDNILTLVPMIA
jgi:hypothetical protein